MEKEIKKLWLAIIIISEAIEDGRISGITKEIKEIRDITNK